MDKNEFKDRLFDVLNDADNLPVQDIVVNDAEDRMDVYLSDDTKFSILVENCGK